MSRARIISVCGDPGGAAALAPVLSLLQDHPNITLLNYAYNEGVQVIAQHKIPVRTLPIHVDDEWVFQTLQREEARFLLTGTSLNGLDREKLFIGYAKQLGIRSLAVLDFWSNYAARFSDETGSPRFVPDMIAVMDEYAKVDMIRAGISENRILVTGQPVFDSLAECKHSFTNATNRAIRTSLAIGQEDLLVMFASQPFKKLYGNTPGDPRYLGFDEEVVLAHLIRSLEILSRRHPKRITLLIRPHPRECVSEYACYTSKVMRVLASKDGNSRLCAMTADLVVGMNSMLLVEACYLGCVVLSLQPGIRGVDNLPTNAWGVSLGVYEEARILSVIEALLFEPVSREAARARADSLTLDASAARRIVDYIYSQISDESTRRIRGDVPAHANR